MNGLIAAVLVLGLLAVLVVRSVGVVPPGMLGVVVRLGRFPRVSRPGIVFVVPILDRIRLVDMGEQRQPEQIEAATKDDVEVTVDIAVYSEVLDPSLALFAVSSYPLAVCMARTGNGTEHLARVEA